ncbi:MAG: hypothetical protein AAB276_03390 [Pseudomonadota bacterium]
METSIANTKAQDRASIDIDSKYQSLMMNMYIPNYRAGTEIPNLLILLETCIIPRTRGKCELLDTTDFPFEKPSIPDAKAAMCCWIVGMQVWYLNGVFAVEAAQQTVANLHARNIPGAIQWLDRMNVLASAGLAINKLTSNMPHDHYMTHVRTAESQYREAFFGGSFKEWWLFKALSEYVCELVLGKVPAYADLAKNEALALHRKRFQMGGANGGTKSTRRLGLGS